MRKLWDFSNNRYTEQVEQFAKMLGTSIEEALEKIISVGGKGIVQTFKDGKGMRTPDVCFAMIAIMWPRIPSILEIGIGTGEATNFLSRLFPKSQVFAVDLASQDPEFKKLTWAVNKENILKIKANLDMPNIISFRHNSFFMPSFAMPKKFNLIFVDGAHEFPAIAWDLMYSYNHLAEHGFMIIHDYGMKPESHVKQAVDYMAARIPEHVHYLPGNLAETIKSKTPCVWKGHK